MYIALSHVIDTPSSTVPLMETKVNTVGNRWVPLEKPVVSMVGTDGFSKENKRIPLSGLPFSFTLRKQKIPPSPQKVSIYQPICQHVNPLCTSVLNPLSDRLTDFSRFLKLRYIFIFGYHLLIPTSNRSEFGVGHISICFEFVELTLKYRQR